jgi:hypothetical protein
MTPDPVSGNFRTFGIPLDGTGIVTAPHVTNTTTGRVTFLKNSMPVGGTLEEIPSEVLDIPIRM